MKRFLIALLFTSLICPTVVLAGGIVTNANQSAAYVRMLARDASTSIDAVYYNPAGLTKLADGFHISLNNQTLFQRKTIENKFPFLHEAKYVGDISVPFFPDLYAVYKKGKFAIGFSFQPNSGGGSAEYKTGLPSFEIPISAIPAGLTAKGITTTTYSADINFDGMSVFWGAQINGSYAINDMISVSAGLRYIYAINTYKGYLRNILINPLYPTNPTAAMIPASTFFTGLATAATGAANSLQPLIAGAGGLTLAQVVGAGFLTQAQANQLSGGLGASYSSSMTISQIQQAYQTNAATSTANATATADQEADVKQTGTGYTPILGVNLTLSEKLNIGIRYEFNTKLELQNDTKKDVIGGFATDGTPVYMFPDKAKIRNDIPAILSVGIGYKVLPQMRISAGIHYYFDKNATIEKAPGVKKDIEGNLYEIALGGEYDITDKILISAGYLYAKTGVGQGYQTDLSHSLSSNSVGFGGGIKVSEKMLLNLGMIYTMYSSDAKNIDYTKYGVPTAQETYNRVNLGFAIGIDYRF